MMLYLHLKIKLISLLWIKLYSGSLIRRHKTRNKKTGQNLAKMVLLFFSHFELQEFLQHFITAIRKRRFLLRRINFNSQETKFNHCVSFTSLNQIKN